MYEIYTNYFNNQPFSSIKPEFRYALCWIDEAIYMNLRKNLRKYNLLYASDADGAEIIPSADYKITREYGEEEKHFNYGVRSSTDTFSQKEDVNIYGQKQKTDVLGQAQETVTSAPRSTDSQDQRTTFDSQTDYDTTHNVTSTIQTVDTTVDAQRTNTSTDATYTDRLTEGSHNIQKSDAAHQDGVVYDEHTDNVYGYKGNPTKNVEIFRKYLKFVCILFILCSSGENIISFNFIQNSWRMLMIAFLLIFFIN